MDLVLCHTTADFDTLGAAVGVTCLQPGARIVLTGGCHPTVQKFLSLRRDHYRMMERRAVNPEQIRSITLVDSHHRSRIGPASEWIDFAIAHHLPITIYDHHPSHDTDIETAELHIESVGATTTLIVEALQAQGCSVDTWEATVMALGIHVDTGSLTYAQATPRDAAALAWLMAQGINHQALTEATEPGLSPRLQTLLTDALEAIHTEEVEGYQVGWVYLKTEHFVPGLSSLTSHLVTLLGLDGLLLGSEYKTSQGDVKLTLIGRARPHAPPDHDGEAGINFRQLLTPLGGGGHAHAASAVVKQAHPETVFAELVQQLTAQIPHAPTARDLMSTPVRTIRPQTTIGEAQRILLRYGHSGLCVADESGQLVGVISRRDIDLALHHGFSHAPVKGYMTTNLNTIESETPVSEIQNLMVTYDIGRLPVLQQGRLQGIVTRTDVLRQVYQNTLQQSPPRLPPSAEQPPQPPSLLYQQLRQGLAEEPQLWDILMLMAQEAYQRGWHLYVVGGAVRDLLLASADKPFRLQDIDLVVDGFQNAPQVGAGVELAQVIQQRYPEVDLQIHGQFQTAALIWHRSPHPLVIDVATARTEFYPYPAANPEVEASSIRQDLYRRDFTINAMAVRLTKPRPGLLIDFFGGWFDLQAKRIRVLHANSFIEDPTRIFRAVRFAVRLNFSLDAQTETFIRYAVESGVYNELQAQPKRLPALQTRLKAELQYILQAPYWVAALGLIDRLGALSCLHPELNLTPELWRQLNRVDRWIRRFELRAQVETWLMLLEVMLAQLVVELRSQVATALHLPESSLQRLTTLPQTEQHLLAHLVPPPERPSKTYQALHPLDLPTLLLVSVRHPRTLGPQVWQYLTQLASHKPLLNGDDLKQLGYKPGPQFRPMLTALTHASLDGDLQSRSEAIAYLAVHFPLKTP